MSLPLGLDRNLTLNPNPHHAAVLKSLPEPAFESQYHSALRLQTSDLRPPPRPHLYVGSSGESGLVAADRQAILGCIIQFVVLSFMSRMSGLCFFTARWQPGGWLLCLTALLLPGFGFASDEHADRSAPVSAAELAAVQTPELSEGDVPPPPKSGLVASALFASSGPSAHQQ